MQNLQNNSQRKIPKLNLENVIRVNEANQNEQNIHKAHKRKTNRDKKTLCKHLCYVPFMRVIFTVIILAE